MTVEQVVLGAREQHPAFTEDLNPYPTVVRFLSRYVRDLAGKLGTFNPGLLATDTTVTLPLAVFAAGEQLPPHQFARGGTVVYSNGDEEPLNLVPWSARLTPWTWPAAVIEGMTLYLLGLETEWNSVASVRVSLVETSAALWAPTGTLLLPDTAESTCVAAVAAFMGGRTPDREGLPRIPRADLWALATRAEKDFLVQAGRKEATVSFVREVW